MPATYLASRGLRLTGFEPVTYGVGNRTSNAPTPNPECISGV